MAEKNPKVSIGLPVFNGDKYLRETIDSILAQTFTDFELVISDNASTDRTEEICKEYAASDSRIRYYRNPENIGGGKNFSRTFELSRGEYFHSPGHDDVLARDFIAKSVEVLDTDPTVILCYSTTIKIDDEGGHTGTVDYDIALSIKPYERFRELTHSGHDCLTSHGLYRTAVFKQTGLQFNYSDGDRVYLSELGLYGRFYRIPEPLFHKRYHSQMSTEVYDNFIKRMAWFNPTDKEKIQNDLQLMLVWFRHYLSIISRAPLGFSERISCYLHVSIWLLAPELTQRLVLDPTRKIRHKLGIKRATLTNVKEVF
jgi:glycosyltransferase involved in cell wall biosynthesis